MLSTTSKRSLPAAAPPSSTTTTCIQCSLLTAIPSASSGSRSWQVPSAVCGAKARSLPVRTHWRFWLGFRCLPLVSSHYVQLGLDVEFETRRLGGHTRCPPQRAEPPTSVVFCTSLLAIPSAYFVKINHVRIHVSLRLNRYTHCAIPPARKSDMPCVTFWVFSLDYQSAPARSIMTRPRQEHEETSERPGRAPADPPGNI